MRDDKLWRVFSVYIRLRDANDEGYCICCTTGRLFFWKDCDAGHFISRRHMATKYNEKNVHAQSRGSNRFHAGEQYAHSQFIEKKYGKGTADTILVLSRNQKSYGTEEINALTKYYKLQIEKLKKEKCL